MHRIKKVLFAALALVIAHGYGQCSVATAAGVGGSGVSGLRTHDHSSAGQGGAALGAHTVTGTLSSTKSAAAGYTRATPNYSTKNPPTTVLAVPGACTAIAVPAGATGLTVTITTYVKSANAVALRYYETGFYSESTCAAGNLIQSALFLIQEFVAVAADSELLRTESTFILPSTVWVKTKQEDASGFSFAQYRLVGYYD